MGVPGAGGALGSELEDDVAAGGELREGVVAEEVGSGEANGIAIEGIAVGVGVGEEEELDTGEGRVGIGGVAVVVEVVADVAANGGNGDALVEEVGIDDIGGGDLDAVLVV